MQAKPPKNTDKYFWTEHSIFKMRQYGLSAQRILRVIRAPYRKEEGIVEKTVAVMQPTSISHKEGKEKWSQEIWAMYQIKGRGQKDNSKNTLLGNKQLKIISTWRYPGVSPQRNPIPEEILREISEMS